MKHKTNPLKIKKSIHKAILALVLLIVLISILLLSFSVASSKKTNVKYKSFGNIQLSSKANRRFSVESIEENIYNIDQYEVNLNRNKLLILNISLQCSEEAFDTLQDNNILIQNAVIQTFANYGSMNTATTLRGKDKIKKNLLKNINKSLNQSLVTQIYFNTFIIQ